MSDFAVTWKIAPNKNELELSLFGPGIGESIVLHLGHGSWIVIDSCLGEDRRPIALSYLEALGVDVSRDVKLVLVTHWHDDHIRGIGEVFSAATSAKFACSAALRNREFFTLVGTHEQAKLIDQTSGVAEFSHILEVLSERTKGRYSPSPDFWASGGTTLLSQAAPHQVTVRSLSPSAQTITDCMHHMAMLMPQLQNQIGRIPSMEPNDLSVVVLVQINQHALLLGADLERGQDERRGWRAIVAGHDGTIGHAYKVAHHGSANADLNEIWSHLLVPNCHAIMTPYARGRAPRPTEADVERIKSQTSSVYCTSWLARQRLPPRRKGADKTINEIARTRRALAKQPGHIRLRIPIDSAAAGFQIELFHGAAAL